MSSIPSQYHDAVVLLVEDDPGDQELTRRALEGGIYRIELQVVNDGEQAMDYLHRREPYQNPESSPRPDLILLDLNMPKVDGKQVLKQLQDDSSLATIPVVVLTTSSQEAEVNRVYELGCNSFITKPVEIEKFTEAIRQLGSYWFKLVALPQKAT